ncbi:hypothetical protein ADEAN_000860400 [Angomonas deanei]|uniref:Uncharacterized protein n=1 Tax=Angomonas deanei TaxID=59799 RepID=A0A7G2CRD8_9TRYP|nr:hypothetical protein ADEAN_000860400 [Angomonas deanei]
MSKPDLSRRHGVKKTRADRDAEEKERKKNIWEAKLNKENLEKLLLELVSLEKAKFLSPAQKERKRLVEKMVADLEKREKAAKGGDDEKEERESTASEEEPVSFFSDGFTDKASLDTRTFVPRAIKRKKTEAVSAADLIAIEERKLLAASNSAEQDDNDFLDSLM